jgi:cytochrome c-type biogenesis protein CcmH
MRIAVSILGIVFITAACGKEPPPPPQATAAPPSAEGGGLAPLTSRDSAAAPAAATEEPLATQQALPPGHPPIGSESAPPADAPAGAGAAPASADKGGSIRGSVDAAPAVKGKIQGGAIFLIARNAASHQIVAVRKLDEVKVPQPFDLSGAHAMTPGTPFEGPLDVTVRWSQRGDAMPAPGDIEGTTKGVAVGATNVKAILSDVRK